MFGFFVVAVAENSASSLWPYWCKEQIELSVELV